MRDYDEARAREGAYERLATRDPKCTKCDERDPAALTGSYPNIVCYEHLAQSQGRSWTEGDHTAGRHNDPTPIVEMPGNDHRIKSDRMRAWPEKTLRNPDRSPLLRAAATLRGWIEALRLILERGVAWIPSFLERLDEWLTQHHGSGWWDDLGWDGP